MATTITALGLTLRKSLQRVFTITYYCDDCSNEFTDEMLCVSHSWCPCCDSKVEPGTIEEHEEERVEFDIDDAAELDPDRLREDRDDRLACLREIGGED